jgi:hypothetical protein
VKQQIIPCFPNEGANMEYRLDCTCGKQGIICCFAAIGETKESAALLLGPMILRVETI